MKFDGMDRNEKRFWVAGSISTKFPWTKPLQKPKQTIPIPLEMVEHGQSHVEIDPFTVPTDLKGGLFLVHREGETVIIGLSWNLFGRFSLSKMRIVRVSNRQGYKSSE